MVSMLCVEGNIPLPGKVQDGNASDNKLNNEELQRISRLTRPLFHLKLGIVLASFLESGK